jgi:tight adherence protein B
MAYLVRARALRPTESRIRYLSPVGAAAVETSVNDRPILRRDSSRIPALSHFLSSNGYADRWRLELERADLRLRPGEYFLTRIVLAVVTVLLFTAFGQNALVLLIGVAVGAMVFMLPAYWVRLKTQRRLAKLNAQLVETITLITNGIRAGFAFAQSVSAAAERVGPPISVELNRMLLDINMGASTEDAMTAMRDRINSEDVDMLVTAILIQRNTGSNLVEVLESVTATMRDRERLQGEIKTMTSQQRLTGWILSVWPVTLGGLFFLINPSMMSLMWTTTAGVVLLVIWAILNLAGIISIRKILDIDI